MDHFPGTLYQIDGETVRALYRLSIRLNDNSTVMSPDDRRDLAHRMRALLRKAQPGEMGATVTGTGSPSPSRNPSGLHSSTL
jgi:hypothetical protein